MRTTMLIIVILILFFTVGTIADVPTTMNYQGYLTDSSGDPIADGSYSVIFTIYDASVAGSSKWTETQNVSTTDGLFAVLLGTVNPIVDTVFNGTTRYLGIAVDADPELSPRSALVSVPYTHRVGTINGASGGKISEMLIIGYSNNIIDTTSTSFIGGGYNNYITGNYNAIESGLDNSLLSDYGFIGSGRSNYISEHLSSILGGFNNRIESGTSFIGGGADNSIMSGGDLSSILGGSLNRISGNRSTISSGESNTIFGSRAFIGAGESNVVYGYRASAVSGFNNQANAFHSFIGGGGGNLIDSTAYTSSIVGGSGNVITELSSFIGGGNENSITSKYSSIIGGSYNTITKDSSVITGGSVNTINGIKSVISGGSNNLIDGLLSAISGGDSNNVAGDFAVISGGLNNSVSGSYSFVPGGYGNSVSGDHSFSAGYESYALHNSTFIWSDNTSPFSSTASNQFLINSTGGVGIGTNAPQTMLNLADGETIQVGDSTLDNYSRLSQNNLIFDRDFKSYIANKGNGYLVFSVNGLTNNNLVINPSGDIGIGTDAPNYKLDVRGTIGNSGTLYHSDKRWKDNIVTLSNSLDKLQKLRGVSFDWKKEEYSEMNFPDGRQIGLIAQEVEQVLPEIVNTATHGYKSVDYSKLVALLIEANKEQQQQIDELKKQVQQLAGQDKSDDTSYGMK